MVLLAISGLWVTACGSAQTTSTQRRPSPIVSVRPRIPARPQVNLPTVGRAQRVAAPGTTLVVTVSSVIDPLRSPGAAVPPGTKPVGVLVSVRNTGSGTYDSSATGDFALLSGSVPASPVYVPGGQCQTPLQDFMNEIAPGTLRTGCVAFAVSSSQAPTMVRFAPEGRTAQARYWAVP